MNISELLQLYDSCFIHFFLLNRSLLLQRNQNEIEIMKTSNPVLQVHIPEHTRSLSGSLLGYKTIP